MMQRWLFTSRIWKVSRLNFIQKCYNSNIARRPIIGILGGVGPMAGVISHQKIIDKSIVSCDQEHLDVIHLSLSQYVGDRTEYLMESKKNNAHNIANPGLGMSKIAKSLSASAAALNTNCVVGVICNTFHSPLIFDIFREEINKNNIEICKLNNIEYNTGLDDCINLLIPGYLHINHMIELTLNHILNDLGLTTVGLMSTTGTRKTNLYKDIADGDEFNMKIVEVDENYQDELHDCIYNQYDGIKKLSAASQRVRNNFEDYVKDIKRKGAKAAILGCTEIPIVLPEDELFGVQLVDPMTVLTNKLMKQVKDNTL